MILINEQKHEFKEFLDTNKEINNLPKGISISTMCATCKLNTELDIDNDFISVSRIEKV